MIVFDGFKLIGLCILGGVAVIDIIAFIIIAIKEKIKKHKK